MVQTRPKVPLSSIRVLWIDGADVSEIQGDMSNIIVRPTVHTFAVESGSAVDQHPVAVGYEVTCDQGYSSDLLETIDASATDAYVCVLCVTTGTHWLVPAQLADNVNRGARMRGTPTELVQSDLMFRQRRGVLAHVGTVVFRMDGRTAVNTGAIPAGYVVHAIVQTAGTVGGAQQAAGLHNLGANAVNGATSAVGYLLVSRPAEVED